MHTKSCLSLPVWLLLRSGADPSHEQKLMGILKYNLEGVIKADLALLFIESICACGFYFLSGRWPFNFQMENLIINTIK